MFVQRIRLTDSELRPEHARSAANLFGLAAPGGLRPEGIPDGAAAALVRHARVALARVATVMTDAERRLREESRSTPCPAEALWRARLRRVAHPSGIPASRYSAAPRSRALSAQRSRS